MKKGMLVTHEAEGSLLAPDQAALAIAPDGEMTVFLPDVPDSAPVPASWKLLLTFASRCEDPEGVEQFIGSGDHGVN